MTILNIIEHPDDRLRQKSAPVQNFDASLRTLVDDLLATLGEKGGIGLCAPQAGIMQRVMVVHVPDDPYGPQVYINPKITTRASPGFVQESCLSVPGVVGNVFRSTRISVRTQHLDGESSERDVEGMHAVCVQHELDHLNGTLFIDRLSWFRKLRMRLASAREAKRTKAA